MTKQQISQLKIYTYSYIVTDTTTACYINSWIKEYILYNTDGTQIL